MRGLIALCVGLGLVLGAGAAWAGQEANECCECVCIGIDVVVACSQGIEASDSCPETCSALDLGQAINKPCKKETDCSAVPSCPVAETGIFCNDGADNDDDGTTDLEDSDCNPTAPTASPYGIAALLLALGGFGAWRLGKRAE